MVRPFDCLFCNLCKSMKTQPLLWRNQSWEKRLIHVQSRNMATKYSSHCYIHACPLAMWLCCSSPQETGSISCHWESGLVFWFALSNWMWQLPLPLPPLEPQHHGRSPGQTVEWLETVEETRWRSHLGGSSPKHTPRGMQLDEWTQLHHQRKMLPGQPHKLTKSWEIIMCCLKSQNIGVVYLVQITEIASNYSNTCYFHYSEVQSAQENREKIVIGWPPTMRYYCARNTQRYIKCDYCHKYLFFSGNSGYYL